MDWGSEMAETEGVRIVNGTEAPGPGDWKIDPAHSELAFIARYLMVTKVRGGFGDFAGTLHIAEVPEDSSVEVTIKAASIDTGTPDRDKHLRSADFLDVERFPELRFKSTKVELTGGTGLKVTGDLTIRDVTKPVVLDAEFQGIAQDPWGGTRAAFSATTEIDREEFGASWNVALETGGWLVSKKVRLELEAQAIRAKPEESGG
jgi:polyisoprenoid-binding protein YceI